MWPSGPARRAFPRTLVAYKPEGEVLSIDQKIGKYQK